MVNNQQNQNVSNVQLTGNMQAPVGGTNTPQNQGAIVPAEEQIKEKGTVVADKMNKMTGGRLYTFLGVCLALNLALGIFGTDIKGVATWGYETVSSFVTGKKKDEPVTIDEKTRDAISDNASTIKTLIDQLAEKEQELDEKDKKLDDKDKTIEELKDELKELRETNKSPQK